MRKVTEQIAVAFLNGESKTVSNTSTDGKSVWLHGNLIAERGDGELSLTLAGWGTPTTRERLNGILHTFGYNSGFHQKNHIQYFDDIEIDESDWITV